MRKYALLLIVLALVLAACAGPAGQALEPTALPVTGMDDGSTAPVVVTDEPAGEATGEPTAENTLEPTLAPTAGATEATGGAAPGSAAGGALVYALVPEESSVTYEVGETFLDQGNVFNVAVGKTQGVTGDIQVNFDRPQESSVGVLNVDISGFSSDSQRRDNAIRGRFLQSAQFPIVTFTPTAIEGLPETIEPGVEYPITLRGDLTVRDTTRPAAFEARVRLQEDTLTGQAATTILMSDYGFGPIDIFGVLKTEDEVKITVDFVARPQ